MQIHPSAVAPHFDIRHLVFDILRFNSNTVDFNKEMSLGVGHGFALSCNLKGAVP